MTRSHEIDSPGFLEAKLNNGLRTQSMNRIGVSLGFVIDMREHDTDLWKHLLHGAMPLKPDVTVYGQRVQEDIAKWKKDLGDNVEVLFVPTIRRDRTLRHTWGPVRREDLDREPTILRYKAANVRPNSIQELSLMLAYEVVTGKPFNEPLTNPVILSGQLEYDE